VIVAPAASRGSVPVGLVNASHGLVA